MRKTLAETPFSTEQERVMAAITLAFPRTSSSRLMCVEREIIIAFDADVS